MVNLLKLKGRIAENDMTLEEFADAIDIDSSTLWRKMKSNGDTFSIAEANKAVEVLKLSRNDAMDIFFAGVVA